MISIHLWGINRKSRKVGHLINGLFTKLQKTKKVKLFTFIEFELVYGHGEPRYSIGQNCHSGARSLRASRPTAAEQTLRSYLQLKTTAKAAGGGEGSHSVKSEGVASGNAKVSGHQEPVMDSVPRWWDSQINKVPFSQAPQDQVKSGVPCLRLLASQRHSVLSPRELLPSLPMAVPQ